MIFVFGVRMDVYIYENENIFSIKSTTVLYISETEISPLIWYFHVKKGVNISDYIQKDKHKTISYLYYI